jgi:drug/metabolite transporter (DMT)-like permease
MPWWTWLAVAVGGITAVPQPVFDGRPFTLGDYVWMAIGVMAVVAGLAFALFNRSEQRPPPRP